MKTTLTRLLATVLFAGISAVVQAGAIPLEDVKVGSTLTGDGIAIGWGNYYPIPKGNWDVVMIENYEQGAGVFQHSKNYLIQLLNKNSNDPLQVVALDISPENKNRASGEINCEKKSNDLIFDRMGTATGQNFQLCKKIKHTNYKNGFMIEFKDRKSIAIKKLETNYLMDRFGSDNPKLIIAFAVVAKKGNHSLNYKLGYKDNTNLLNPINEWLTLNMYKMENYYSNNDFSFSEMNIN